MIEHILFRIEELEHVDTIYVVTNAKYFPQFERWQKTYNGPKPVVLINDGTTSNETRLGPIGDIHLVVQQQLVNEDILVVAGDNLFGFSLLDMHRFFHQVGASVVGLYDIKEKAKIRKKLGNAILDEQFQIIEFLEKPEEPKSTLAATCMYMIRKTDLEQLERCIATHQGAEAGVFIRWLSQNTKAYGFVFAEHWFDVGTPEDYHHVNTFYSNGKK